MFLVYWGPELLSQLSAKYNDATTDKRRAILNAIERLDAALSMHPLSVGESRDAPGRRIAVEGPVSVHFRVYESRRLVRITRIGVFRS